MSGPSFDENALQFQLHCAVEGHLSPGPNPLQALGSRAQLWAAPLLGGTSGLGHALSPSAAFDAGSHCVQTLFHWLVLSTACCLQRRKLLVGERGHDVAVNVNLGMPKVANEDDAVAAALVPHLSHSQPPTLQVAKGRHVL